MLYGIVKIVTYLDEKGRVSDMRAKVQSTGTDRKAMSDKLYLLNKEKEGRNPNDDDYVKIDYRMVDLTMAMNEPSIEWQIRDSE